MSIDSPTSSASPASAIAEAILASMIASLGRKAIAWSSIFIPRSKSASSPVTRKREKQLKPQLFNVAAF
jgi:hypothetical protein